MLPSKTDIEKLANDFIESDKEWGGSVIVHDIDEAKPICVFGILNTDTGLKIKDEMIGWLSDNYSVVELYHNGKCYEYPAIKLAQKLCVDLDVPYTLYIHTKGAVHKTTLQSPLRDMWKREFSTDRKQLYINKINTDCPTVVTLYTSKRGDTWCNGFFCNKAAWLIKEIYKNTDRYYFEHIFRDENGVKMIGILKEGINAQEVIRNIRNHMFETTHKRYLSMHEMFRR